MLELSQIKHKSSIITNGSFCHTKPILYASSRKSTMPRIAIYSFLLFEYSTNLCAKISISTLVHTHIGFYLHHCPLSSAEHKHQTKKYRNTT